MTRLLVVGAGGHASVVVDAALAAGTDVVGVADDSPSVANGEVLGRPVLGTVTDGLEGIIGGVEFDSFIVAIGDNRVRGQVFERLLAAGLAGATVIHPASVVAPSATIGAGTLVCAGAVINPLARIGANAIVNTRASVDHHCTIGDHCHIAPGTTLGGEVTVGTGVLVGIGATLLPQVSVGDWATVGGGAVVTGAVTARATVTGVPAEPRVTG